MTIAKIAGAVSPLEEAEKINELIDGVNASAKTADLADVATSGSYGDLSGVPTNVGDFTNDAGYLVIEDLADYATNNGVASSINTMLATLYPIGSIYIGTQVTCPLATLISGSTWVLVSSGRVLQGADNDHNAGTTIAAGLPNITGTINGPSGVNASGVFTVEPMSALSGGSSTSVREGNTYFDASRSSSIYGSSDTVQPPAYVVNIWQRTA